MKKNRKLQRTLSTVFFHVHADLYNINGKIYFVELTFLRW